MHTFEQDIPANINAIHNEIVNVVFRKSKVGKCKLRAEGNTLVGTFQLNEDLDFEKNKFQYAFTGGSLTRIQVVKIFSVE